MSKDARFYVEQPGVRDAVYFNDNLRSLEKDVMEKARTEAEAAFLQEFGYAGKFDLEFQYQPVGGKGAAYIPSGRRPVYRLVPGDANTARILNLNPGWLGKFAENAKL